MFQIFQRNSTCESVSLRMELSYRIRQLIKPIEFYYKKYKRVIQLILCYFYGASTG